MTSSIPTSPLYKPAGLPPSPSPNLTLDLGRAGVGLASRGLVKVFDCSSFFLENKRIPNSLSSIVILYNEEALEEKGSSGRYSFVPLFFSKTNEYPWVAYSLHNRSKIKPPC